MTAMSNTLRRGRMHSRSSQRWGALVGILVTFAAIAAFALVAGGHRGGVTAGNRPSAAVVAQRAQLTTWETAVAPLIQSAGQVVALGPRQGAQQIETGKFSAATNRHMAAGWVARLTALRGQIAALPSPAFLGKARALLDRSMAGYVAASQDLLAATFATGSRRTTLLDASTTAGRTADRLYDQATAAIATWRDTLGLPADWSKTT
jgi:hypothetical protein